MVSMENDDGAAAAVADDGDGTVTIELCTYKRKVVQLRVCPLYHTCDKQRGNTLNAKRQVQRTV